MNDGNKSILKGPQAVATPFQMEQIPVLAHQEENTSLCAVSMHTEISLGQNSLLREDSTWTLPEPVQHTLTIIYSPMHISSLPQDFLLMRHQPWV